MSSGELKLTGESFDALKNTVDDLSRSAVAARKALAEIFNQSYFSDDGGFTEAQTRVVGQMVKNFGELFKLVDKLNGKLVTANVRMKNLFSGQAGQIKDVAAAIAKLDKVSGKAGGGLGGGGGGAGGGGAGGGFPWEEQGDQASNWKANWVSSLDTVMSVDKLKKNIQKKRDTANLKDEKDFERALKLYRKQNADAIQKQVRAEEKRAKQIEKMSFVSSLSLMASADKVILAEKKKQEKAEKERARDAEKAARASKESVSKLTAFDRFFNKTMGRVTESAWMRTKTMLAIRTMFGAGPGAAAKSLFGGGGAQSPFGYLSKFAESGQLGGGFGRFRMFQKPFPGSERNIFALGDLAAGFNNIIYGVGGSIETTFSGLTQSASSVSRALSGVATTAVSLFSPALGSLLGSISDLFIGTFEKLSSVVAGVIGSLTRFATSLTGFATRAVEAAANFTEAVNAARVVSGQQAASSMERYARNIQREYGLSATDAMRGMGRIAGMLVQQGGFSQQEAGAMSQEIARQLADVASVNNRNLEDLMRDMMSGLAGRFTPLRKNMLSFQAPVLDMQARSAGVANPNLRTDLTARIQMFVKDFMRQTELFTGDLERTRYEFANQRRKFLGGFEALFLSVGRILEPFAKAIIIAANDLMDQVIGMIDPLTTNPYERFQQSIADFAWYVVYAKNAIVELATRLYESRGTILDWAIYLGKAFGTLAVSLTQFSVGVLRMVSSLVSGMGGLLPMIETFGRSLLWLSETIDTLFPSAKQNQISQMEKEIKLIETGRSEYGRPGSKAATKRLEFLNSQTSKLKGPISPDVFNAMGDTLQRNATILEKTFASIKKQFEGIGLNPEEINAQVERLLQRMQPVESAPGQVKPPPPISQAGDLVRYFDPASFRDAIQGRDVASAQIQTAQNTGKIVEILSNGMGAGQGQMNGQPVSAVGRSNFFNPTRLENFVTAP